MAEASSIDAGMEQERLARPITSRPAGATPAPATTAPTATGNGAEPCVPSGAGSPVPHAAGAGESSRIPEWMRPMVVAARSATIEYMPGSPAAAVSALATYRAAVRLALRQLYAGQGEGAIRRTLAEGLLTAEGYVGRMDEAVELISQFDAATPRETLDHYTVLGTFWQGRRWWNHCACGRGFERMGAPDEAGARRHVYVMNLPNIHSSECDCPGNRDAIPVWDGRCSGCGAVLYGAALTNRKGAA